jgi:hypothetical protein
VRVKARYKNVDAGESDPAFEVITALGADRTEFVTLFELAKGMLASP